MAFLTFSNIMINLVVNIHIFTQEAQMKIAMNIFGVLLVAVGIVWILQGVNILPGSFMTGQIQWAYNGTICALIGAVVIYFANRRKKSG